MIPGGSRSETGQIGELLSDDISFIAQILVTLQPSLLQINIKRFSGGLFEKMLEMGRAVTGRRGSFAKRTRQNLT